MKISRRKFIEAAPIIAGAVVAFNGDGFAQVVLQSPTDGFAGLSWSSFWPYLNTDFSFYSGGNEIPLKLVDMTDNASFTGKPRPAGQEAFILKFTGPAKMSLGQGTYRVNHFAIGDFEIFITEGGVKGKSKTYFAVINRILS
jgi:hypothetical protein